MLSCEKIISPFLKFYCDQTIKDLNKHYSEEYIFLKSNVLRRGSLTICLSFFLKNPMFYRNIDVHTIKKVERQNKKNNFHYFIKGIVLFAFVILAEK